MKKLKVKVLALALALTLLPFNSIKVNAAVSGQYTNPLMNGADPTIVRGDDGYFYSGFGTDNDIYIKRSETLLGLSTADSHLVFDNPRTRDKTNSDNGKDNYYIWGPYIYRIDGAWYIYYSSSTENDFGWGHPSCYVLENTSPDPFKGEWVLKGSNTNVDDFEGNATKKEGLMNTESYGLACGIVTIGGERYFTYTKYEYFANEPGHTKFNECPTIVKMENPWTLTGPECTVARPRYDWELKGDNVDEGAAVVEHDGKVYFAHSSSSFTNDNYCVGLSVIDLNAYDQERDSAKWATLNDYIMDENNWKKSSTPIMSRSDENGSFGPGSPLFVKSPDGTEDWLIYHGGPIGGQTSTDRRVRAQKINWTDDGMISLGIPSNPDLVLDLPSGEVKTDIYEAENANYANVTKRLFNNTAKASGSGYIQYDKGDGYVEFNVDADATGTYALSFRYNNLGDTVNAKLSVDDKEIADVAFPKNGTYAVDLDNLKVFNIPLTAGNNKVKVYVSEQTDFALDAMVVTRTNHYRAINAELTGGAAVDGDHVGGMYHDGAKITFTVNVPHAGYYALDLLYSNAHNLNAGEPDKCATVSINGVKLNQSFPLFITGKNWGDCGNRIDNVYLNAGTNTITYENNNIGGRNTSDVNYYSISLSEAVTNTYSPANAETDTVFTVNVESEALYDITFAYDATGAAEYAAYLGQDLKKEIAVKEAGQNNVTLTLKLSAGTNTITLKKASEGEDSVTFKSAYVSRRLPWAYQTENGTLKNVKVATDHLYYNGTGFVGGFENLGDSVSVLTNVATSGTHTVSVRYSGAANSDRTISMYVNGKKAKTIALAPTSDWDTWEYNTVETYLYAGKNTIEYRVDEGDTGRLNLDEVVIDKYSTGATTAVVNPLQAGEVYIIKDKNSQLSADIEGYSDKADKEVHLWNYLGNNNQKWKLVDMGNGYWQFKGTFGSKRLSVKQVAIDGNPYYVAYTAEEDAKDDATQWKLVPVGNYYKLVNKMLVDGEEMVLSVYQGSKTPGAKLYLAPDQGLDSQLFSVDGGQRMDNDEVREIEEEQNPEDTDKYGNQYEVLDPVLPEPFDQPKTIADENGSEILRYEAEAVTLDSGAELAHDHPEYSGDGFVGGMWRGDASITFKIKVETAGNYTFTLRYCNGYGEHEANRAAATYLNGEKIEPISLPSTGYGNWDSWGTTTFSLDLKEGVNTLTLRNRKEDANNLEGSVNYDYLEMNKYPNTVAASESPVANEVEDKGIKTYELEAATLSSGACLATDHNDYTGSGFVGGMYNGSAKIGVVVDVETAGTYRLEIRYANGHGQEVEEKCAAVFVNGKYVKSLNFPKTGNWDTWDVASTELTLNAGISNIEFVNSSSKTGHAADVNYDYMILVVDNDKYESYKESLKEPVEEDKEEEITPGTGDGQQGGNTTGEGGNTPDEGGNTSGEGGNTPGEDGNTPDEGGNTPDEGGNTPGEDGNTPDEGGNTSGEDGNTSGEDGNTPGTEEGQPGDETPEAEPQQPQVPDNQEQNNVPPVNTPSEPVYEAPAQYVPVQTPVMVANNAPAPAAVVRNPRPSTPATIEIEEPEEDEEVIEEPVVEPVITETEETAQIEETATPAAAETVEESGFNFAGILIAGIAAVIIALLAFFGIKYRKQN